MIITRRSCRSKKVILIVTILILILIVRLTISSPIPEEDEDNEDDEDEDIKKNCTPDSRDRLKCGKNKPNKTSFFYGCKNHLFVYTNCSNDSICVETGNGEVTCKYKDSLSDSNPDLSPEKNKNGKDEDDENE
ncbi:hypothetical protein H4219_003911 [Mycoemilia scoparia]|uniref:Chitin-binding type-2 domain-containing protein n=1 Tax=Mycoemilia scoparia TaxID=417184 RepID=A0A9W8A1E3_9FUNG|nr:hypothetical protein H4219_003911 [Mycoemilia scoparia]